MILTIILILTAIRFVVLIALLILSIKQRKTAKGDITALSAVIYTDAELYILEILNANKGKRLTTDEIGCSLENRAELIVKLKRLKTGELANKKHIPTYNVISKEENGITRYGIRK